jgi:hypothetical protein
MTSPIAIRGIEQWNRWSTDHSPLLESEDSEGRKSRMLGGGIRLLPVIKYWFIFLALGLLLTDSFRLAFSANSIQYVSPSTHAARNVRTVHGISHGRETSAKRHSGV